MRAVFWTRDVPSLSPSESVVGRHPDCSGTESILAEGQLSVSVLLAAHPGQRQEAFV